MKSLFIAYKYAAVESRIDDYEGQWARLGPVIRPIIESYTKYN